MHSVDYYSSFEGKFLYISSNQLISSQLFQIPFRLQYFFFVHFIAAAARFFFSLFLSVLVFLSCKFYIMRRHCLHYETRDNENELTSAILCPRIVLYYETKLYCLNAYLFNFIFFFFCFALSSFVCSFLISRFIILIFVVLFLPKNISLSVFRLFLLIFFFCLSNTNDHYVPSDERSCARSENVVFIP